MIVNLGARPDGGDRKHNQFRPELFIKDSSLISLKQQNDRGATR